MAVTIGTYGATDAAGWTVVTPSDPSGEGSGFSGSGTRKIYCDSSAENDSGDGSQASPKKTVAAAVALLRDGKPDHVYFKKGQAWTAEGPGVFQKNGRSADEPMLFSAYGTGARPLFNWTSGNGWLQPQGGGTEGSYIAVIGLEVYSYKRDPDNVAYDATKVDSYGIHIVNDCIWWLVEDCKFHFHSNGCSFQNATTARAGTLIFRRNVVCDNYATTGSGTHAQGIFSGGFRNLIIEENIFDHNGWLENAVDDTRDVFKHNVYLDVVSDILPVIFRGNITARACANGLQQRPGGTCYDNLFLNNPIAGFVSSSLSEMSYNVVLQGTDIQSSPVLVRGQGLLVNTGADGSIAHHNIVAHQDSSVPGSFAYSVASGVVSATLRDNITYDWQATNNPLNQGTGTIASNNAVDGAGYLYPNRSVATYSAAIGGTESLEAFLTECRLQSKDNWVPEYTAAAVNDYIRAGFGMVNPSKRNRARLTAVA